MFKPILLKIIYYLSLSGYNTFYKYMAVKKVMDNYFFEDEFMKLYKSSSNSVSYLNIFVLSLVCLFLIDFLINVFVFYISKMPFKDVFTGISKYLKFLVFIFISYGMLYINNILSLIVLFIGFLFYMFDIKMFFSKKCFWIIFLLNLFSFLSLYFISF